MRRRGHLRTDAFTLGSLFQEQFDDPEPTAENLETIWAEICRWQRVDDAIGLPPGALQRSRLRTAVAGLRPFRGPGVRVEADHAGDIPVIHNYGHGGSGYTLAGGCAEAVAALLRSL